MNWILGREWIRWRKLEPSGAGSRKVTVEQCRSKTSVVARKVLRKENLAVSSLGPGCTLILFIFCCSSQKWYQINSHSRHDKRIGRTWLLIDSWFSNWKRRKIELETNVQFVVWLIGIIIVLVTRKLPFEKTSQSRLYLSWHWGQLDTKDNSLVWDKC